ncbi:MAG: phosphatase PAP2 family protein [Lachnospiraceae bacterium]|nr:phosphatase PAP2 family protein [Lachnospiraceae bacterium]
MTGFFRDEWNKTARMIDRLVPLFLVVPLIFEVTLNMFTYFGSRLVNGSRVHADLTIPADAWFPLIPWTVVIYIGAFALWIINYILACHQDTETAYRLLSADFAAKIVCLLCFMILPTTNVRPEIAGDGFWEMGMQLLYAADAADNLFPSIHCLTSTFCVIAVRENPRIPVWYKVFSLLFAAAICVSTLTTKQHVVVDVIAGVLLAEGSYLAVRATGFDRAYGRLMSRLFRRTT